MFAVCMCNSSQDDFLSTNEEGKVVGENGAVCTTIPTVSFMPEKRVFPDSIHDKGNLGSKPFPQARLFAFVPKSSFNQFLTSFVQEFNCHELSLSSSSEKTSEAGLA